VIWKSRRTRSEFKNSRSKRSRSLITRELEGAQKLIDKIASSVVHHVSRRGRARWLTRSWRRRASRRRLFSRGSRKVQCVSKFCVMVTHRRRSLMISAVSVTRGSFLHDQRARKRSTTRMTMMTARLPLRGWLRFSRSHRWEIRPTEGDPQILEELFQRLATSFLIVRARVFRTSLRKSPFRCLFFFHASPLSLISRKRVATTRENVTRIIYEREWLIARRVHYFSITA